jgi:hypothetical protein
MNTASIIVSIGALLVGVLITAWYFIKVRWRIEYLDNEPLRSIALATSNPDYLRMRAGSLYFKRELAHYKPTLNRKSSGTFTLIIKPTDRQGVRNCREWLIELLVHPSAPFDLKKRATEALIKYSKKRGTSDRLLMELPVKEILQHSGVASYRDVAGNAYLSTLSSPFVSALNAEDISAHAEMLNLVMLNTSPEVVECAAVHAVCGCHLAQISDVDDIAMLYQTLASAASDYLHGKTSIDQIIEVMEVVENIRKKITEPSEVTPA